MSYNYKIYGQIKLFFDDRQIDCKEFETKVQRQKIVRAWGKRMISKMVRTRVYYEITLFDEQITHLTSELQRVYKKSLPTPERPPKSYSNIQWNEL